MRSKRRRNRRFYKVTLYHINRLSITYGAILSLPIPGELNARTHAKMTYVKYTKRESDAKRKDIRFETTGQYD